MKRERSGHAKFLAASIALHVIVLGAGLISWPWLGKTKVIPATPVTLLTSAQMEKLMAAQESPEPQHAQTEEPVPDAQPEPPTPEPSPAPPEPAPAPQPAPQPKAPKAPPTPAPQPAPKAPPPKPAPTPAPKAPPPPKTPPAKPTPARPDPGFDLDALAASLQKNRPQKSSGAARSAADKGMAQIEADLRARAAEGDSRAAINDFTSAVADQLGRAWRPNCGVEGTSTLRIRVRLRLNRDGSLIDAKLVDYPSEASISDPVTRAAATRALSAVSASAPFRGLPPVEAYDKWKTFIVTFAGRDACG